MEQIRTNGIPNYSIGQNLQAMVSAKIIKTTSNFNFLVMIHEKSKIDSWALHCMEKDASLFFTHQKDE
jgi:hypothetical protein